MRTPAALFSIYQGANQRGLQETGSPGTILIKFSGAWLTSPNTPSSRVISRNERNSSWYRDVQDTTRTEDMGPVAIVKCTVSVHTQRLLASTRKSICGKNPCQWWVCSHSQLRNSVRNYVVVQDLNLASLTRMFWRGYRLLQIMFTSRFAFFT